MMPIPVYLLAASVAINAALGVAWQRAGNHARELQAQIAAVTFLSCLCGRKLGKIIRIVKDLFLSCLCGRKQHAEMGSGFAIFLSCLCGRKLQTT